MDGVINIQYLINAVVFSLLGLGVFTFGFVILDKVTPYHLWKEIVETKNVALAILVGSIAISIGMIIAAAIHG